MIYTLAIYILGVFKEDIKVSFTYLYMCSKHGIIVILMFLLVIICQ